MSKRYFFGKLEPATRLDRVNLLITHTGRQVFLNRRDSLFASQGDHRIRARRTQRWQEARCQRNGNEQQRTDDERCGVKRGDAEQDRLHGARPPLEEASLSSSSGMVNRFAAALLRARPVRSPVLPQSARAACPAFSPDVDADVCRWGDGLHSWSCSSEQAYPADVPVGCSQVHTDPYCFSQQPAHPLRVSAMIR
jgi:hypothetical protein